MKPINGKPEKSKDKHYLAFFVFVFVLDKTYVEINNTICGGQKFRHKKKIKKMKYNFSCSFCNCTWLKNIWEVRRIIYILKINYKGKEHRYHYHSLLVPKYV